MNITLKNMKCNYPSVSTLSKYGKYSIELHFKDDDKEAQAQLKKVKDAVAELVKNKLKGKKPKYPVIKQKDEDAAIEGHKYYIVASNNKGKSGNVNKPVLLDAKGNKVTDSVDDPLYSGCIVHAKISLYTYDNEFGKGVSIGLIGVVFAGDDTPLGGHYASQESATRELADMVKSDDEDEVSEEDELDAMFDKADAGEEVWG